MVAEREQATAGMKDAISKGDLERLKRELAGTPPDLADRYDETLLMHAALAGNLDIVKYLVEIQGHDVNVKSLNEANALIRAALSGNLEVVRCLVEHGSELNAVESLRSRNADGYMVSFGWESHQGTALHAAIAMDALPIVEYLVTKGADPFLRSPRGHNAFEQAVRYARTPIIDYLAAKLDVSIGDQVIAAARLNQRVLQVLIEGRMAAFDFEDGVGMTPLMYALRDGDYEFLGPGPHPGSVNYRYDMAEYLLKKGADAQHRNACGQTPLMLAATHNDSALLSVLIQHGADPSARDEDGKQAIDYLNYPPEPPESWENAHMAWGYESAYVESIAQHLRDEMNKAGGSPTAQPEG